MGSEFTKYLTIISVFHTRVKFKVENKPIRCEYLTIGVMDTVLTVFGKITYNGPKLRHSKKSTG